MDLIIQYSSISDAEDRPVAVRRKLKEEEGNGEEVEGSGEDHHASLVMTEGSELDLICV